MASHLSFSVLSELPTQFINQRLWDVVTNTPDRTEAVRILAKILVDKKGRAFALDLEPEAAKLCIETLDYVSRDLRLPPFAASDGLVRALQNVTSKPLRRVLSSSR